MPGITYDVDEHGKKGLQRVKDTEPKPPAERVAKPVVPRYDRDGRRIEDGPKFGAATRQVWESAEERAERLQPPEGDEREQAMSSLLGQIEEAKAGLELADTDPLTMDEAEDLVSRATLAGRAAARKVLEDNPPNLAGRITAQHERAFRTFLNGEDNATSTEDDGELTGDPVIGTDALGNTVYCGEDGEAYILADANEGNDYDEEDEAA
jgi:hypothetical protein